MVDDSAYDALHYYNWLAHDTKDIKWFYASRQLKIDGIKVRIWLHKLLADAPGGWHVKQLNGDRYDCQAKNLVTISMKKEEGAVSPFNAKTLRLGVRWSPYYGLWESYLDKLHVGYHRSTIEAATVYNNALRHIKAMQFVPNKKLPMYKLRYSSFAPFYEGASNRGR